MSYIYLASPYTHKNPNILRERYNEALRATVWLMEQSNKAVFSPIVYSHNLGLYIGEDYRTKTNQKKYGEFWHKQDTPLLIASESLCILCLDGWDNSKGIKWEIKLAKALDKFISYLTPVGNDYEISS